MSNNLKTGLYVAAILVIITGVVVFQNWRYKACRADGLSHNTCFWMVIAR